MYVDVYFSLITMIPYLSKEISNFNQVFYTKDLTIYVDLTRTYAFFLMWSHSLILNQQITNLKVERVYTARTKKSHNWNVSLR